MSSKTSKNRQSTRAAKQRGADKTERPVSNLEWAKAYIDGAAQGALVEGNPDPHGMNPFIQRTGGRDTVNYVRCSLELLSQLSLEDAGIGMNKDLQFGQFLILQTMVKALQAADGQMKHDEKLARARGIVAALDGAP